MNDVFILERISKSLKNPQIQTDFQFCSKLNSSTSTWWKYSTANPDGKTIIHFVKDPKTKTRKHSQKMRKQVPNEHFQNSQFHNSEHQRFFVKILGKPHIEAPHSFQQFQQSASGSQANEKFFANIFQSLYGTKSDLELVSWLFG